MPGAVEVVDVRLAETPDVKFLEEFDQVLAMQIVEPGPGPLALTHLLHCRLIVGPPAICKGVPILLVALRPEKTFRLAGDAVPTVHHGAEHVESESLHIGKRHLLSSPKRVAASLRCRASTALMSRQRLLHAGEIPPAVGLFAQDHSVLNVVYNPQKGGVLVCRRADGIIPGAAQQAPRQPGSAWKARGRLRGTGQARLSHLREDIIRSRGESARRGQGGE